MPVLRKTNFTLLLIFFLACFVRLYGISFGLPHTRCRPDEEEIIFTALQFFSGDLNPHFFNYPTLYMYLLFGIYTTYFLIRAAFGGSVSDFLAEMALEPARFFLMARILSAIWGALTTLIVFLIGKYLFGKKTAFVSAFFMSIAYLHVRDSHFGTTDITMTFFITCATLYIVKSYKSDRIFNYLTAGVFTGLATATKYGGILLIVPMVVAHVIGHATQVSNQPNISNSNNRRRMFSAFRIFVHGTITALKKKHIWLYGVCTIGFFLVFTPFALLDFNTFSKDFLFEVRHLAQGHGIILQRGWWYHLRYTLPYGTGWLIFLSSFVGVVIYAKKDCVRALILYLFPVIFYVVTGKGYTVFVRYMIPMIPFICIASASCVTFITTILTKALRNTKILPVIVVFIAVFTALPSIYHVLLFDNMISTPDNRLTTAEWIIQNIPPGSTIYHSGSLYGRVQLPLSSEALEEKYQERLQKGGQGRLITIRMNHLKSMGMPQGYQEWKYDETDIMLVKNSLPDYIIIQKSPLTQASIVPKSIQEFVKGKYLLMKSFEVVDLNAKGNWYDQQDDFYVPFVGFKDIRNPGPNLYIYERIP